jgi:hypothetical protein
VRTAAEADLEACNQVCRQVHGHDRGGELQDAIARGLGNRGAARWTNHRLRHHHRLLWSRRG